MLKETRRVFWSPSLRDSGTRDALVRRLWDAGMLREVNEVRERVGLFTVARPDGLQRLVVDPRPTNVAWGEPPPVRLTSGAMLARQLGQDPGRFAETSPRPHFSNEKKVFSFQCWSNETTKTTFSQ